jgi:hypothetical protein
MPFDTAGLVYSQDGKLIDTFDHLPPCGIPVIPPVQIKLLRDVQPSQQPLQLKEPFITSAAHAELGTVRGTQTRFQQWILILPGDRDTQ